MTFELRFSTDNAAFQDGMLETEIGIILNNVRADIDNGRTEGRVVDANGNSVGSWSLDSN